MRPLSKILGIFVTSVVILILLLKFVSGDGLAKEVTIKEGWNLREIGYVFENNGLYQAEELHELVGFPALDYSKVRGVPNPKDFSSHYDFLKDKPKNVSLEGYLFPGTYSVRSEEPIEAVVRKMLDNFGHNVTQDLREEIRRQGKSIFQMVTMASILEKEAKTFEDRQIVSGILWNRLRRNVPLKVEATIAYITGKKSIRISKEDIQIDSPYNTYRYEGLPLGPICNPGLESILSAVHPKDSEYLHYFSEPEGQIHFSKNLEEHKMAKAEHNRNSE